MRIGHVVAATAAAFLLSACGSEPVPEAFQPAITFFETEGAADKDAIVDGEQWKRGIIVSERFSFDDGEYRFSLIKPGGTIDHLIAYDPHAQLIDGRMDVGDYVAYTTKFDHAVEEDEVKLILKRAVGLEGVPRQQ